MNINIGSENRSEDKAEKCVGFIRGALLFLILLLFSLPARAALDLSQIGVGARPLGMGKAYVALADDTSAIFFNPAGLSRNDNLNLMSMAGTMLGDVNYIVLGAADISPMGKFGIGFINASVGGIPLTTLTGSGSTLAVVQTGLTDYNSSQLVFSYGSKLSRFLKNGAGSNVALGLNLKFFMQGFSGGGASMQNTKGSGMDADLGLLWDVNRWLSLGCNFQNLLPQGLGGKFVWEKNNVTESIPLVVHSGGRFRLLGPSGFRLSADQRLDLAIDNENIASANRPGALHIGLEYSPFDVISLRAGIDQSPRATENGTGVDNNLTAGVGLCIGGFTFDYAYHQFGDLSENTTHFFSIGYIGEEPASQKARKQREHAKPTIPLAEIAPKPQLSSFPDVPENYWAHKPIIYLATLGIMDGFDDMTFRPTKEMTRGELAVLLVKAKGFTVGKDVKVQFKDVPLQSFEAPYISLAVERKYISGYPDGTFRPQKRVTRGEAAVVLARFSGLYLKPKISERAFPDVPVSHWASPAIAATKAEGLFEYLAGKGFGPNLYLTRAEAAEIISKTDFAKKKIEDLISGEKQTP